MARKTFYDVLELSKTASPEALHAAYERLSAKFSPHNEQHPENATDARKRMKYEAIQESFVTLRDPVKRALYDQQLKQPAQHAPLPAPAPAGATANFWNLPNIAIAGVIVLAFAMLYTQHRENEARLRNEAAATVAQAQARAQEAMQRAALAQAEWRASQVAVRQDQVSRVEEIRAQGQVQLALLQYQADTQRDQQRERQQAEMQERNRVAHEQAAHREQQRRMDGESRRKQEETQAAIAARQQLARDRNELCLLERQRYGRALSC